MSSLYIGVERRCSWETGFRSWWTPIRSRFDLKGPVAIELNPEDVTDETYTS